MSFVPPFDTGIILISQQISLAFHFNRNVLPFFYGIISSLEQTELDEKIVKSESKRIQQ